MPDNRDGAGAHPTTLLAERLRFTRIGPREIEALQAVGPLLDTLAESLVEAFYDHLRDVPRLRALVEDERTVERLRSRQLDYIRSLSGAVHDEAFVRDRHAIGAIHERIGLDPQWYIGTYAVYLERVMPEIIRQYSDDPERAGVAVAAFGKQLLLDMQLILDMYFRRREQSVVSHAEQLAAVGKLAASVAHEVRNPLAGIRGALQVLAGELEMSTEQGEVVGEVVGQIDRLDRLVRDLLTYATPRRIRWTEIDLRPWFERHARLVSHTRADVQFRIEVAEDASLLYGDLEQLDQVLLNLVQNALQAMPHGGELTLKSRLAEGRIEIGVCDEGEGIDEATLARVFTPFFSTRHRGSGLGLSIVHGIVERHGGRVTFDSTPGGGTTVRLSMPPREGL